MKNIFSGHRIMKTSMVVRTWSLDRIILITILITMIIGHFICIARVSGKWYANSPKFLNCVIFSCLCEINLVFFLAWGLYEKCSIRFIGWRSHFRIKENSKGIS